MVNKLKSLDKKGKAIIIAVSILIIGFVSIGIFMVVEKSREKEIIESIDLKFFDHNIIEYGSSIDYYEFIDFDCSRNIDKVEFEEISSFEIGLHTVEYLAYFKGYSSIYTYDILIEDTKPPIIEFSQKELEIRIEDTFYIKDYIVKVYDIVDGEIEYAVDDSLFVASEIGTFEIFVIAFDKNGLETREVFILKVKEKKEVIPDNNTNNETNNKQNATPNSNANISNNQPVTPPIKEEPSQPEPPVCTESGTDGIFFATWEEADAYGDTSISRGGKYFGVADRYATYSGKCGFTVRFYNGKNPI